MCAGLGGRDVEKAIIELFSQRGETKRVTRAKNLGREAYVVVGLGQEFDTAIEDILLCVKIRNQYAHCIWHDDLTGRLAFANMEEIAGQNGPGADTRKLNFFYVDMDLLHEQEKFFSYVMDNLNYLNYQRRKLVGDISDGAILRLPTGAPRPRMHLCR